MTEVVLDPLLWESVEAGSQARIDAWCVAEGDLVQAGELLAHARLLHQTLDVSAPHAGVVEQIIVAAGETFARGEALARLIDW